MRSFRGHCDRSLVLSAANTFQRVGLALSMAGSVVSASFWCVDVHCACFVAFSLYQATVFSNCFAVFIRTRSFHLRSDNGFASTLHASWDSLWSWRLAMVGSVCACGPSSSCFFRVLFSVTRFSTLDCLGWAA